MNYLENDICVFTPLFNIDYNIKKNIISGCFFKMMNTGYKNFSIYFNGLKLLYSYVTKNMSGYHLRIFIDNSIYDDKEIMNKLKLLTKLELVLFSCVNYLVNNKHIGLFGTLIRFFPMFNFKNNDANYVLITDIDDIVLSTLLKKIKIMNNHKQIENIYIIKFGNICKNIKYNYNLFYQDIINPYALAQSFVSIKRLDYNLIINFIKEVKKSNKILSYYYEFHKNNITEEFIKKYESNGSFNYGIDEYFLNKTLTEYIISNNMPIAINMVFEIFAPIYYILDIEEYLSEKKKKLVDILLNFILNKIEIDYNKNFSLKKKFELIDEIIYKKNNKLFYQLNLIIYKMFLYFYKNKNYKFLYPEEFYKLLLSKEYFGMYNFNVIKYYNIEYNDIILSSSKFNDNDINKLNIFFKKYK